MRKITQDAIRAFTNMQPFKRGNTEVKILKDEGSLKPNFARLILHGNTIAEKSHKGIQITSAGWKTNTTKERLNGLPNVNITQKDFVWYLNGHAWNGGWIKITD